MICGRYDLYGNYCIFALYTIKLVPVVLPVIKFSISKHPLHCTFNNESINLYKSNINTHITLSIVNVFCSKQKS